MDSQIDKVKFGKFFKHVCLVSKQYHEKEQAKEQVDRHLDRLSKKLPESDIEKLTKKINLLLQKQASVASLGRPRDNVRTISIINNLRSEVSLLKEEKSDLMAENRQLTRALEALSDVTDKVKESKKQKKSVEERIDKVHKVVDREYKKTIVNNLKNKIEELEQLHKEIAKDITIDPARLHLIEEKLELYKEKLKKL